MSITVEWDNDEKTIIRYTYTNRWTWDEFYAAQAQQNRMQETVSRRVNVLVDARNIQTLPDDFLTHLKRVMTERHPQTGLTVIVSSSGFLRSLFNLASRLFPSGTADTRFVSSEEDAYNLFRAEDAASAGHAAD